MLRELGELGCLFVVSAVETVDDRILKYLDKGHTQKDVIVALHNTKKAGIHLKPSLLPFTPWTTVSGYLDLLNFVEEQGLVYHVDPVHYSIRLLLPPGSKLLKLPEVSAVVDGFSEDDLVHQWAHPDARVDELQKQVALIVESGCENEEDLTVIFAKIKATASGSETDLGVDSLQNLTGPVELRPPNFSESWFC